jgi:hypothetical protein
MNSKCFSSGFARDASGHFTLMQSNASASWATTWADLTAIHRKATKRTQEVMLARSREWEHPLSEDTTQPDSPLPAGAAELFMSLLSFCVRGKTASLCSFMVKWLLHIASCLYLAHHPDGDLKDMNIVVLWGDCDDHTHLELAKNCFPNKQFLEALSRHVPVLVVNEYLTSQTCSCCGRNVGTKTVKHNSSSGSSNQRFFTCKNCRVQDAAGVWHYRVLDKDLSAGVVGGRVCVCAVRVSIQVTFVFFYFVCRISSSALLPCTSMAGPHSR